MKAPASCINGRRTEAFFTNRQTGQSLTEFAVALVVLVPLLLIVPLLGKYSDMNQAALAASRYAAWEKTVDAGKSDAKLADEVRLRYFGDTKKAIKSADVPQEADADRNAFWVTHTGSRLLDAFQDVAVKTSHSKPSSVAGLLSQAGSWFELSSDNLYRADIGVKVADVPNLEPLNNIKLNISRHNVILADAWDAGSPANEKARVKHPSAVPTDVLDQGIVGAVTTLLNSVGSLFEPALAELEFGYVKPDVVPGDRRP